MNTTTWLVVNEASGSWSAPAVEALCAAMARGGHPPARQIDVSDGLPAPGDLDAAGVGVVAVYAGDGTINTLATALEGWGGALLVLPGGTANLLARAIHGEREAEAIAETIPALQASRRKAIRWSGGSALVEVLAGPGATWSDVREEMREGAMAPVAGKAVEAIRQSTSGPMVVLSDPPLGRPEGYSGVRLAVTPEGMEAEGYGADNLADYLRQGLALLRRNFREGPHDELGHHASVACRSADDAPLALMVDGERREGRPEERFSLDPFALDLLAPAG